MSTLRSRRTASFSAAISSIVSPRYSVWSSPTEVSTVAREPITLVASSLPPSPASITPTSTLAAANATKAAAVNSSNCVTGPSSPAARSATCAASSARSTAWSNAASAIGWPPMTMRSLHEIRWGET